MKELLMRLVQHLLPKDEPLPATHWEPDPHAQHIAQRLQRTARELSLLGIYVDVNQPHAETDDADRAGE